MTRALVLLVGLVPAVLAAQSGATPLVVAPAVQGTVLRWVWPPGERPAGYFVERREAGTATWVRLTPSPLTRLRDRARAREILGSAFDRYATLLFPADPRAELRDVESYQSALLLMADVEPGVARVLGLRYDDQTARAGQAYTYRLAALTGGGETVVATSGPVTAGGYQPAAAPDSLQGLQGRRGVELKWTVRPAFSAYNVYRSRRGGPATLVNDGPVVAFTNEAGAATAAAPMLFRDTTAVPGDTLAYAVEGLDAFGRPSRRAAPVTIAVRDVTPPAPPPTVATEIHGDTVVVRWRPSSTGDVVAYQLWRSRSDTAPFERVGAPVRAPVAQTLDPGRPARRVFWYRVTAVDRSGNESAPSFAALAEVPDLTPPDAPDSVRGTADTNRLRLAWRAVAASDLLGYRVYRATVPGGEFVMLTRTPQRAAAFADTVPRAANHPYYYRVTAVDSAYNESRPSAVFSLAPPDLTQPSAPEITAVRPGEDRLIVTWLANPEPDVARYRLRWRLRGAAAWTDAADSVSADRLVDTIAGVPAKRLIEVSLVAVDRAGNRSVPARPVVGQAYHRTSPPALEVRRAAFDAKRHLVVIEWDARAADSLRVIVLRRSGTAPAIGVGEVPAAARRFEDRTAAPGIHHAYGLRVVDRYGNAVDSRRFVEVDLKEARP
jgi:fibronectin type 3 domain-containing protein